MNVVILTQNTPAYIPITLDRLLTLFDNTNINTVGYIAVPSFSRKGTLLEFRQWYEFYGPKAFAQMCAYSMSNKILSFLGISSTPHCIMRKYGVAALDFPDVNSDEFVEFVKEKGVDVVISIAFPKRISEPVIRSPRVACINFHDGLLPKYRGRVPLFWAMLNEETEVGLTVHEIDAEFDNGPMLVQERMAVQNRDSLHSLFIRVAQRAPDLLVEALRKLESNAPSRLPNPAEHSTYFRLPTAAHTRRFRTIGKRFFN